MVTDKQPDDFMKCPMCHWKGQRTHTKKRKEILSSVSKEKGTAWRCPDCGYILDTQHPAEGG